MKKLKDLFNKLVDKVFGKRCQCDFKIKDAIDRTKFVCQQCGKVHG